MTQSAVNTFNSKYFGSDDGVLHNHCSRFVYGSPAEQIDSANCIFQMHCSETFKPNLKGNSEDALF